MIIYYNLDTKEIIRTEENTMIPVLPSNSTFEEKVKFYEDESTGFIAIPQELGSYIWDYKLCFDGNNFIGLQPKGV